MGAGILKYVFFQYQGFFFIPVLGEYSLEILSIKWWNVILFFTPYKEWLVKVTAVDSKTNRKIINLNFIFDK